MSPNNKLLRMTKTWMSLLSLAELPKKRQSASLESLFTFPLNLTDLDDSLLIIDETIVR
jgi:hypothetical protein